ncbi:unnamed protein product [Staurois parvus]|uniref:Uncharacterized protein n=1 Tax=Staurois parvus TaxID=386267 RepID=A0ABN9D7I4_9NEOB|nr:unnamed protein product [Staurois parvus]
MTVGSMYRRECEGYDSGQYVQNGVEGGMTVGSMYRSGVRRYDSGQYVQERRV